MNTISSTYGRLHRDLVGSGTSWSAVTGVVVFLLFLATLGCSGGASTADGGKTVFREEPKVRLGTFQDRFLLTGVLKSVNVDPIIIPQTPSWMVTIQWMEDDGALVKKGQPVLELDNTQFSGELESKRLEETRALNQMMQKEADIAVALREQEFALERARIALERAALEAEIPEQFCSRQEYQATQLGLAQARISHEKALEGQVAERGAGDAELEELRIALERARREVKTAEQAIEALILRAPRDGILIAEENWSEDRKFQEGDSAYVGNQVMQIPDLTEMKVVAHLSDVDDGRVAPGMRVSCTLDAYPDQHFPGRLQSISPLAEEQGRRSLRRAFLAEILLENVDSDLMRPEMSVRVEVFPRVREEVLLVPRETVDFSSATPRVLLENGSWADVRLGPCSPTECVVEEGLREGDLLGVR